MSYTPLDSGLIHSTIWREPGPTRLVWITMLALADRHDEVMASIPGLADVARVTVDECRVAIDRLLAPDPDSRNAMNEGRRIEVVPGGWYILNRADYRERARDDHRRALAAERARRHRARNALRNAPSRTITPPSPNVDVDVHVKELSRENGKPKRRALAPIPEDWRPTEGHASRASELGVTLTAEAEKFWNWAKSNDKRKADWDRAFTNWLLRSAEFAGRR